MAAYARLNNEFTEDENCHNFMRWLKFFIKGFTEPVTLLRDKHPAAWKNSGGIAVYLKHEIPQYCSSTRLVSLSDTRNLVWLKFDCNEVSRGLLIICGFTYMSPENSSVHAEEDRFQIIEDDIAAQRLNYASYRILVADILLPTQKKNQTIFI